MARRAAFFASYKEQGKPKLVIAGPYEFLIDDPFTYGIYAQNPPPTPSHKEAVCALKAHTLLHVDLGWLSPSAAQWLSKATGKIPPGYQLVNSQPISRIVSTAIGKIGIVLFPQGPTPGKAPSPEQEQKVLEAGRALQSQTRFVIGVSPWGLLGEKNFLPKAQGVFACILGGGEGVAFAQSVDTQTPGILWARPDSQGRAVNVLEILEISKPGAAQQWIEGVSFRANLLFLGNSYPPDPAMERIVGLPENETP